MSKVKAVAKKTPSVGYIIVTRHEYETYLQKTKEKAVEEYCDCEVICIEDIDFDDYVLLHVTHSECIEYVPPKHTVVFKFSNKKAVI